MIQPFHGIRVLDLTHVLAGPFCAYQLAVLGADTIKVEPPGGGDMTREAGADDALNRRRMGTTFMAQGSNKRSLSLDLKTDRGAAILKRLIANTDVFIENYRSNALAELGLGFESLKSINPRLIYCSMTGFGQNGPKSQYTAYDNVIQAASGLMTVTGTDQVSPMKIGAPVLDYASGATAAFAVASALFQRERTGVGQYIDVSMLDAALILMSPMVTGFLFNGSPPSLSGNDSPLYAGYSCYETRDGLLMLGAFNARQNVRLWLALERPELAKLSSYAELRTNRARLQAELARILVERSAEEWEQLLNANGVPAARVRTLSEALAGEQLRSRGILHQHSAIEGVDRAVTVPVAAFQYAHGGPRITAPPPLVGQHTDEILGDLGLSNDEIASLHRDGVI